MEIDPSQSEAVRQKSEALRALSTGPVSSSISKLSESSRVLPSEKDFHFYYNFDEFRAPIDEIGSKSQSMLQQIGSSNQLWGGREMGFPRNIEEDACDWLVDVNDEVIGRFDKSVDESSTLRKEQEEGARAEAMADGNGFQLVGGKKKKVPGVLNLGGMKEKEESAASPPAVRMAERDKKTVGPKPKVPFHIPTIKRPQDEYNILVNNANQPFQHVWLERSEDGSRVIHPLEKLSVLDFVDRNIENLDPVKPPPLDSTAFKMVEKVKDLKDLAAKLHIVNEFAVDLEHNQYRSFQGLTCLMQISTRTEDFVVDTLKLRIHIGPYLREVFKDPTKRKVMHGADRDIAWLQRDFGIYVCNLFDTGQASRVLQMERNSLEYLLQHFCGVTANKQYQNADWRLRPLPEEMTRYAREDTHYLLYIYDLMKIRLISESTDPGNSDALLLEVYKRSYDVCMQLYEKELLTDTSYLYIYGVQGANLNAQQLSIVAAICQWRDGVAREEDESTGYIVPNKTLLEIAKQVPLTTSKLRRLLKSKHPYVERNLSSLVSIIRHSVQNASAFETIAEQLKEGHIQVPEVNDAAADFPEVRTAGGHSGAGSDGSQQEYVAGSLLLNKGNYQNMGNDSTKSIGRVSIGIGKNGNLRKNDNDSIILDARRGCLSFRSRRNEINAAEATVQLLKKPNRAFGALLGSSASKKTTDLKKEKGEDQLEQIRSSVNLPFYSFSYPGQQSSKHAPEQQNRASDTTFSGEHPDAPALGSDSEDIILLESDQQLNDTREDRVDAPASSTKSEDVVILLDSDSNDEEPPYSSADNDNHVNMTDHQEMISKPELVVLDDDDDDDDEPMSLSDLSSSFQKCLQSIDQNQNQTTKHDGKSEEAISLQFEPFDHEDARNEVKFGEEAVREVEIGENDNDKNLGKTRGGVADGSKQEEGGFSQVRTHQAFPVSGNPSTTFR